MQNKEKGKLYISCGVPGAGKSTWLEAHKGKDEIIVSRDKIRFSIVKEDEEYFSHETKVFHFFIKQIANCINSGINTYADATHLNSVSRNKLLYALKKAGCEPSTIEVIWFDTSLPACLSRNEKRKGTRSYVPRGAIRRMWASWESPEGEGFDKIWKVNEAGEVEKVM